MADQSSSEELLVYFAHCPTHGPEHRIYAETDLHSVGSIRAVESVIESETYWFMRLGLINPNEHLTFSLSDLARLPRPLRHNLKMGRRNPAFGRSQLERWIFESIFHSFAAHLQNWKHVEEEIPVAYAIKKLRLNAQDLQRLAAGLTATCQVYDAAEVLIIKYWTDDGDSGVQMVTEDDVLSDLTLTIPFRLRWGNSESLVTTEVFPSSPC